MQYDDTITIITGILTPLFVEELIESYKEVKHKMVSTWKDSNRIFIEELKSNGFKVVLSESPNHGSSANNQIVCVHNGIRAAMSLGYKYICRSRTDIFPKNHIKFLEVIRDLYMEKVTVLCGVSLFNTNFYLDVIMCGSTEQLLVVFSRLQEPNKVYKNPELYFLENYAKRVIETQEDVKKYLNFAKDKCIESNIEIIWYRPYDCISFPRTIPYTNLISEYCNAPFIYN